MSYIEYVNARPHGEELTANLAGAFGYDPVELELNRTGRLSPQQARRMVRDEIANPLIYASLSLAGTLAIRFLYLNYARGMDFETAFQATIGNLFLLRFSTAMENLLDTSGPSSLGFSLASLAVFFVAFLKLVRMPWKTLFDVLGRRVKRVTGRVDVRMEERQVKVERGKRESIPVHFFAVKEYRFEVTKAAVEAVMEGEQYDLYFTPAARHLVGIEPRRASEEAAPVTPDPQAVPDAPSNV